MRKEFTWSFYWSAMMSSECFSTCMATGDNVHLHAVALTLCCVISTSGFKPQKAVCTLPYLPRQIWKYAEVLTVRKTVPKLPSRLTLSATGKLACRPVGNSIKVTLTALNDYFLFQAPWVLLFGFLNLQLLRMKFLRKIMCQLLANPLFVNAHGILSKADYSEYSLILDCFIPKDLAVNTYIEVDMQKLEIHK